METPKRLLWLVLIIFSTFLQSSLSELCHPQDKKVLLQIKKAFNDPYTLASWDPQTDCCHWYCVQCDDKTHRITNLFIHNGDLAGPIPHQVGDLPFLEFLDFHRNPNLTGPIPPAIAKLKKLRYLMITWTNVSGPIPDFIGEMNTLEFISLSLNNLTGPIPSNIGLLKNLSGLRLDRNKLTGPIPHTFGKFKDNFYLYLNHNQLSGKIPASLGETDFSYIDLSRNKLEGDASTLFGSKKSTWDLDISRNLFEFDFSNIKFSEKHLFNLDINHNKIFGSLPEGLTKLSLQSFNVSYNRLCGKIPVGGRLQTGFDYSAYFHNRCLCGAPLPSCK